MKKITLEFNGMGKNELHAVHRQLSPAGVFPQLVWPFEPQRKGHIGGTCSRWSSCVGF